MKIENIQKLLTYSQKTIKDIQNNIEDEKHISKKLSILKKINSELYKEIITN